MKFDLPPLSQGLPPVPVPPELAEESPLAAVIAAHRAAWHLGQAGACAECDEAFTAALRRQ